ncbi:uncharacterized protein LOC134459883 [Engraulis encrasicolus]|uniref:uncharacterized protein LOC134459883 n=1 Tax=Engraulis encrasicolus TaxID=184585 RepID=UPI002FD6EACE
MKRTSVVVMVAMWSLCAMASSNSLRSNCTADHDHSRVTCDVDYTSITVDSCEFQKCYIDHCYNPYVEVTYKVLSYQTGRDTLVLDLPRGVAINHQGETKCNFTLHTSCGSTKTTFTLSSPNQDTTAAGPPDLLELKNNSPEPNPKVPQAPYTMSSPAKAMLGTGVTVIIIGTFFIIIKMKTRWRRPRRRRRGGEKEGGEEEKRIEAGEKTHDEDQVEVSEERRRRGGEGEGGDCGEQQEVKFNITIENEAR